jgi:hypothetical protein
MSTPPVKFEASLKKENNREEDRRAVLFDRKYTSERSWKAFSIFPFGRSFRFSKILAKFSTHIFPRFEVYQLSYY